MSYTPGQISEMLDIPPSSLRRLSAQFAEFLTKSKGRHRRYTEADIAVLRRVREGTLHGKTLAVLKSELALVESRPKIEADADALSLLPAVASELTRLDDSLHAVLRELEQLRADRQADQERIAALEAQLAQLSLPWWRRLLGR